MPKILVNVKYNKKNSEWSVLPYERGVFADMPIALMDMDAEYDSIIVVPINKVNHVFDKEEFLSKNKFFSFVIEGENVREAEKDEEVHLAMWLPIDTDISKLRYIQNQLVMVEEN